jgi:hypothetical protein
MHYVFKSRADADLIMMAPAGDQILSLIGKAPAPRGIIEVRAIPAAMQALEQAIAGDDAAHRSDPAFEEEGRVERVGLHQRAWPLLEMMKRSIAEQADIVWGV